MNGEVSGLAYQPEDESPAWASPRDGLQDRIEATLDRLAPGESQLPERLSRSMRYSLLAPGKRVRARLTILSALDLGASLEAALVPACTIEMVHAASLVIDDLPVMDDAAMRRGVATNHRVYGEDTAILAAIGLLTEAFRAVASDEQNAPDVRNDLVAALARHLGPLGLVGGQEMDLHADAQSLDAGTVSTIHMRKTGALFSCAAWAGARIAGRSPSDCRALEVFGERIGLAFQTYDDLADSKAHFDHVGKDTGNDGDKTTLVRIYGAERAMREADDCFEQALTSLHGVDGGAASLETCAVQLQAKLKKRITAGPDES